MKYTTFGRRTGLRVSEYALGTANFGTAWGVGAELDEARKIFDRFADAGGTLIDTADSYQDGDSERFLKEFLAADRDHFVVATKYTQAPHPRHVSTTGNSRKSMTRAVEASLRRLGTDYLDLYWVHFPDRMTPIEEILSGLHDLAASGKILHAGLSNFPAWRVAWASATLDARAWHPVVGLQVEYSLAERGADRELLPMADALGLGAALWSPLSGGLLTGKYRISGQGRLTSRQGGELPENTDQKTAILDALLGIATQIGASASQVAMAWLRARAERATTAQIPIIGPRTYAQLEDYLAALDVQLGDEQIAELDRVSAIKLGVPHHSADGVIDQAAGGSLNNFLPRAISVP